MMLEALVPQVNCLRCYKQGLQEILRIFLSSQFFTLCGGLTLVIPNTQNNHQALIPRIFRRMEEDMQVVGMLAWVRGGRC